MPRPGSRIASGTSRRTAPLPFLPPDCPGRGGPPGDPRACRGLAFGRGRGGRASRSARRRNSPRTPGPFAACSAAGSLSAGPSSWPAATSSARRPEAVAALPRDDQRDVSRSTPTPADDAAGTARFETPLDGIDAFLDDFTPPPPGWPDWRRFRDLHLRRVSLGVESGDPEVRALYGKDWKNEDLMRPVADLKDAGPGGRRGGPGGRRGGRARAAAPRGDGRTDQCAAARAGRPRLAARRERGPRRPRPRCPRLHPPDRTGLGRAAGRAQAPVRPSARERGQVAPYSLEKQSSLAG